jgi:putative endonuclease
MPMKGGWVYILSNRPNGSLYVGVTNDVVRRVWEHRNGVGSSFVHRYNLDRLVFFESHPEIQLAIARETRLKHWPRAWKIHLIEAANPDWEDLCPSLIA